MGLPPDEKQRETAISAAILSEAQDFCEANGHEIGVLSGGGSGNYRYVLEQRALTELQAGGAALMDVTYEQMGVAGHHRALSLICQVVSANASGRAAGDAGWKATGRHTGLPLAVEPAGVSCVGLSAEHTHFAIEEGQQVQVGDRVRMIPHYSDSTVLLHRQLYAVRGNAGGGGLGDYGVGRLAVGRIHATVALSGGCVSADGSRAGSDGPFLIQHSVIAALAAAISPRAARTNMPDTARYPRQARV